MFFQPLEVQTLEMVAVALSEEYGVKVICGGRRAETTCTPDGRPLINIPSVHYDDEHYLTLLRGYIDHEVGHVRFTDNVCLDRELTENTHIIGSLKTVATVFEDVYIERMMGECFPGCKRNLRKLNALVFAARRSAPVPAREILHGIAAGLMPEDELPYQAWRALSQYILYRVRSETSLELAKLLPEYREIANLLAPGLAAMLEPVLARVPEEGVSTQANMKLAKETIDLVMAYFLQCWHLGELVDISEELLKLVQWILRSGGRGAGAIDVASAAARMVEDILENVDEATLQNNVTIRHEYGGPMWKERLNMLSDAEQREALQASAMMDAQMQSLLQTFVLNREGPFKIGRLNTNALYKLHTCDTKIFCKNVEKRDLNTEIVIAVDMSGSMNFNDKCVMASKALYAVVHCMKRIRGLIFNVIGFFDNNIIDILRRYDRVSPRIKIVADGGTLCGNTVKYAMQHFTSSWSSRKIIMMITDGDANDMDEFHETISRAKKARVEFLGVGILDEHITKYLEEDECCVIDDLHQLAPEIFRMLRGKLYGLAVRGQA